ncbi:hypothetical protein ECDEC8C_1755 [Escherichia coli DEC8C]|uniref:Uncharacterized protein n=1 Tax=Escherichia coli ISC7 TaxID=1432555 RepID=W1FBG6_ECOLX|nr:hypothetical protein ECDEC8C_1755 [Escherichia coli DEC8C]CDL30437.1 hypothetical protein [Escherichia coli ISC7]
MVKSHFSAQQRALFRNLVIFDVHYSQLFLFIKILHFY